MEAIRAEDVSIKFLIGDFKKIGLKDYVIKKATGNYHVKEFWADRHITFTLECGDMLGIIGLNGAGKSTLLKAVTGLLVPTEGILKVHGRVAALLELASGFDPEMTVSENTYLRGAMMGYTKKFMQEKYDEIIRFAELEDFQDLEFKQLSSGMRSRLGFSIASLVDPDIIILDEVLSVGDGAFRKKSSERMRQILKSGVTGMLVSHSVGHVKELCNKILWLDHGRQVIFSEEVEKVCDAYEEFLRCKKTPKSDEDIEELAREHRRILALEKDDERRQAMEQIKVALREEETDEFLGSALGLIERSHPDLLDAKKVNEFRKMKEWEAGEAEEEQWQETETEDE